jgi:hypothetical protein
MDFHHLGFKQAGSQPDAARLGGGIGLTGVVGPVAVDLYAWVRKIL